MNAFLIERPRDPTETQLRQVSALTAECRGFGNVLLTPFRYDLAGESEAVAEIKKFIESAERVFVLGFQFPRAQQWTLEGQGISPADAIFVDVREENFSAEKFFHEYFSASSEAENEVREVSEEAWPRWYPVVDVSRCVNCKACLNFCLFGVYGTDTDGRIFVEMPNACRPGCPACARVCPRKAIIFPMCEEEDIAGKFDPLDALVEEIDNLE